MVFVKIQGFECFGNNSSKKQIILKEADEFTIKSNPPKPFLGELNY